MVFYQSIIGLAGAITRLGYFASWPRSAAVTRSLGDGLIKMEDCPYYEVITVAHELSLCVNKSIELGDIVRVEVNL